MPNPDEVRYRTRLDALFDKICSLSGDIELQAHWSRYLCVLVSGYLETSVVAIFGAYARDRAAPNIVNYVINKLDGFQNPNMTKIIDLSNSFNPSWGQTIRQQTDGELKDAIDSISANRNLIAHGKDTGITFSRIFTWYKRAIHVIELIEQQCDNN
jgi:RiboL-PSP-HEPN